MDKKLNIKTDSGFECEVPETALMDMRLLDALVDIRNGEYEDKVAGIKYALDVLLGQGQKKRFYSFIEEKEGYADLISVTKGMNEIISKIGESKKN